MLTAKIIEYINTFIKFRYTNRWHRVSETTIVNDNWCVYIKSIKLSVLSSSASTDNLPNRFAIVERAPRCIHKTHRELQLENFVENPDFRSPHGTRLRGYEIVKPQYPILEQLFAVFTARCRVAASGMQRDNACVPRAQIGNRRARAHSRGSLR